MQYNKDLFIYPPRPKLYHVSMIDDLERSKNCVAQLKLNGTRTEVIINPKREITLYTRHGTLHKAYKLSPSLK